MRIHLRRVVATLLLLALAATAPAQLFDAALTWESPLEHWVANVEYSRFGNYLAAAHFNGSIYIFDREHRLAASIASRQGGRWYSEGSVLAFAPDERHLVVAAHREKEQLGLIDLRQGETIAAVRAHSEGADAVAMHPGGRIVASAARNEIALWELADGTLTELSRRAVGSRSMPQLIFTPSGEELLVADYATDTIMRFRLHEHELVEAGRLVPHQYASNKGYLNHFDITADGRWVATGVRREVTIWERIEDEYRIAAVFPEVGINLRGVGFGPDSSWLFVSDSWSIYLFRLIDGEWVEFTTLQPGGLELKDLDLSPLGGRLAIAGSGYEVINPLEVWSIPEVSPGPLAELLAFTAGRFSAAQRALLDDQVAQSIIDSVDPDLLAPQDMFETAEEYTERLAAAGNHVQSALALRTEAFLGIELQPIEPRQAWVVGSPEGAGSYEIETQRYTLPVFATEATLELPRDEARDLYRNWQDASVRARRSEISTGYAYDRYELLHPTNGEAYPLDLYEDPFLGTRIDPVQARLPEIVLSGDLTIVDLRIDGVFPSLYRYYTNHPIGTLTLQSTGRRLSDLAVTLQIPGIMERPTRAVAPAFLDVNDRVEVSLLASLSRSVLNLTEGDTVEATIEVGYREGSREVEDQFSESVRLLNRNAIRWDDDRKVGAFLTVNDSQIQRFAGHAVGAAQDVFTQSLSRPLLQAMRIFEAVRASGVSYVVDPSSAYSELSRDELAVDFLRFPAETLSVGAGDCDDLSVLYNTLLEAVGIRTAFVTTPGHIFTAFAIEAPPELLPRLYGSAEQFIYHDGAAWVPVETTALRSGFVDAWDLAAAQWRSASEAGTAKIFTTAAAWQIYEPVGIDDPPASELPGAGGIRSAHERELSSLVEREIELLSANLRERGDSDALYQTRIGLLYARYAQALDRFKTALAAEPLLAALLNAANIELILGSPDEAIVYLERAQESEPDNPRVQLALTVARLEKGDRTGAEASFRRLERLAPSLAARYPLFGTGEDSTARAAVQTRVDEYLLDGWVDTAE